MPTTGKRSAEIARQKKGTQSGGRSKHPPQAWARQQQTEGITDGHIRHRAWFQPAKKNSWHCGPITNLPSLTRTNPSGRPVLPAGADFSIGLTAAAAPSAECVWESTATQANAASPAVAAQRRARWPEALRGGPEP